MSKIRDEVVDRAGLQLDRLEPAAAHVEHERTHDEVGGQQRAAAQAFDVVAQGPDPIGAGQELPAVGADTPLLGHHAGDAKIFRNAGARVTDDALRSLVLAANLLDVVRVCVVQHTDCAMVGKTDDELRATIGAARGVDASGWEFLTSMDQMETLAADLRRIDDCPLLPDDLEVRGFIFDVRSGELRLADLAA